MSRFKIKHRSVIRHVPARLIAGGEEADVQMSGLLKLKTGSRWRQSWWVLKDHVLYRYEAMNNPSAKETFPVLGWTLETLSDVSLHTAMMCYYTRSRVKKLKFQF